MRRTRGSVATTGWSSSSATRTLVADLGGRMRWLADLLDVSVDPAAWPGLVQGATFASMRAEAGRRTPDQRGVLKDPAAFFKRGQPGAGHEALSPEDTAAYAERVRGLVASEASGHEVEVLGLLGVSPG